MEFTRPGAMKPKVDSKMQEHLDEYLKRRQAEKLMEVHQGG